MNSDLFKFHRSVVCNKRAPRHDLRMLLQAKYTLALDPPPDEYALAGMPDAAPSYWMNDTLGDCTKASWADLIFSLSTAAGRPFVYADGQVEEMYEQCDGYVPGDPATDNGSDGLTTLQYLVKSGANGHAPEAYLQAALGNVNDAKIAARYLGGLYTGLTLPTAWQGETTWDVSPQGSTSGVWAPGSWGGHMVYLQASYTPDYVKLSTWKETYLLTWPAYCLYVDEPFSVIVPDFASPDGFDTATMEADLAAVRS